MSWFNAGSMSIKIQFRDKTHIDELVRDIQETLSNHYEMLDTEKLERWSFFFSISTYLHLRTSKYILAGSSYKEIMFIFTYIDKCRESSLEEVELKCSLDKLALLGLIFNSIHLVGGGILQIPGTVKSFVYIKKTILTWTLTI